MTKAIDFDFAHECFDYKDGDLFWKKRPLHHFVDEWRQKIFHSRQSGKKAGTKWNGYIMINFTNRRRIGAHRVVFLMHHGYLPKEVDHINGNSTDNRIENLRAATHSENLKNMKTGSANTSGHKGVSYHKTVGKWAAYINIEGKMSSLGLFDEKDDAIKARKKAERDYYGEFSNDR